MPEHSLDAPRKSQDSPLPNDFGVTTEEIGSINEIERQAAAMPTPGLPFLEVITPPGGSADSSLNQRSPTLKLRPDGQPGEIRAAGTNNSLIAGFHYDHDRINAISDAHGTQYTFHYNESGLIDTIAQPNTNKEHTRLNYDKDNKLVSVSTPDGNVDLRYNEQGELDGIKNPKTGEWQKVEGSSYATIQLGQLNLSLDRSGKSWTATGGGPGYAFGVNRRGTARAAVD